MERGTTNVMCTTTIVVHNMPPDMDGDQLQYLFSPCGSIIDVRVRSNAVGRSNSGTVTFKSHYPVRGAIIQFNGVLVCTNALGARCPATELIWHRLVVADACSPLIEPWPARLAHCMQGAYFNTFAPPPRCVTPPEPCAAFLIWPPFGSSNVLLSYIPAANSTTSTETRWDKESRSETPCS